LNIGDWGFGGEEIDGGIGVQDGSITDAIHVKAYSFEKS
jgi:hypothetical protein